MTPRQAILATAAMYETFPHRFRYITTLVPLNGKSKACAAGHIAWFIGEQEPGLCVRYITLEVSLDTFLTQMNKISAELAPGTAALWTKYERGCNKHRVRCLREYADRYFPAETQHKTVN